MRALPEGVELMTDLSAARWVVDGLRPWGRDRIAVTSMVPEGFDAYARIPHSGEPGAMEGEFPAEQLEALIESLSGFTSTLDRCWFCMWAGYGFWWQGAHKAMFFSDPDGKRAAEYERVSRERDQIMNLTPQVQVEAREYFLFRGPVSAADSLVFDEWQQSPNLWWPDDRAWCVASEIDLPSTYVGASRRCIDRLIATPVLNANEVAPDDDVSKGSGH